MLDGVGVGALPDAADYGDATSDTLGNLSRTVDLRLPFLRRLGLGSPGGPPRVRVVAEATPELTEAARAAGAWDVLEKDASTRDVANAIRSAAHG